MKKFNATFLIVFAIGSLTTLIGSFLKIESYPNAKYLLTAGLLIQLAALVFLGFWNKIITTRRKF
jgi:hypothetical protein